MRRGFVPTLLWFNWASLLVCPTYESPFMTPPNESHDLATIDNPANNGNVMLYTPQWTVYIFTLVSICVLVLLGAIFAGLTLGLMGLDLTNLQVIKASGTPEEQYNADKVLRLLAHGKHWVLVTLLLSNVVVNETLPILLDSLFGGGWQAILISTVLIVIFGEVIPQSVCVRYGLSIGAKCSKLVLVLMYVMWPLAYPIALLLDYFLGKSHGTVYKKAGLKTLVSLHRSENATDGLTEDEVHIIGSVLDLRDKPVSKVMTPIQDVFTLTMDDILDKETVDKILFHGYSRIPICAPEDQSNFFGMLLVKQLITYDVEDALPVRCFNLGILPETSPDTSCLDILNFFQEGKSHLALLSSNPGGVGGALGVITLEDVIEELIGEEIIDETDIYIDVHKKVKVIRRQPKTYVSNIHSILKLVRSTSSVQSQSGQGNKLVIHPNQNSLLTSCSSHDDQSQYHKSSPLDCSYGAIVPNASEIMNQQQRASFYISQST
ncbi:hypothetical protein BCR42DRAFT_403830 [Absidia repens]|uniref:CNNM transmembrane domain-containing protein n=1 Tax=Absidia repens TaxID=90262 RepID=A0A1X2IVF3_9FUNG|nr:hypothetical protein BCR42DRAFT_403830 [Absidia repens]